MDPIQRITRSSANKNQANSKSPANKNQENLTQTARDLNSRNVTKKSDRILELKNITKGSNPKAQTNKLNNFETALLLSHFALAVFDESTGEMMEMRELLHHPDPTIRKE